MTKYRLPAHTALALVVGMTPAAAQDLSPRDAFIEANLLAIFYHELGHAVIDLMQVPIFGQEEDAADVMSVMLIDWLFEEEAAQAIAYDSAFGYVIGPDSGEHVTYWGLHGPDEQRYYNHVCLFYGANPDERDDLAADLGLPEERAETCPEEYDMAASSWGSVFDEMEAQGSGVPMVFVPGDGEDAAFSNDILALEVEMLNEDLSLPREVTVFVESCGEVNAYYIPDEASIVMCTEFATELGTLYDRLTDE